MAQIASSLGRIFLARSDVEPRYYVGEQLQSPPSSTSLATSLNPYVLEAASHAHDIGHPPFGHAGEDTLNDLVKEYSEKEVGNTHGFEGNAQSFRVVTRLGGNNPEWGMNLTRATLNALVKYPWDRESPEAEDDDGEPNKWGYYTDPNTKDEEAFEWVRDPLMGTRDETKVLEAQIMDYADDITYAVHDLFDFFRSGIIPLDQLLQESAGEAKINPESELTKYSVSAQNELDDFKDYLSNETDVDPNSFDVSGFLTDIVGHVEDDKIDSVLLPFQDTDQERTAIKQIISGLITQFLEANRRAKSPKYVKLEKSSQHYNLDHDYEDEITVLKSLTKYYVINSPALSQQQHGQVKLLENLYKDLYDEATRIQGTRFPQSAIPQPFRERLKTANKTDAPIYRTVADMIASMTERQVLALHKRLRGWTPGSVHDHIIG